MRLLATTACHAHLLAATSHMADLPSHKTVLCKDWDTFEKGGRKGKGCRNLNNLNKYNKCNFAHGVEEHPYSLPLPTTTHLQLHAPPTARTSNAAAGRLD
jgi:hypothetical protein